MHKKQVARWQLVLQIVTRWTLDVLLSSSTSTPRKEVPPSVQLLLEEVWAKQTWRPRQSWSGGSQGSSCPVLCWLLEGRCKPGKEGPGGDGGESPVLTQSKAEPVMFFPESLIVRALHSFYARMEALVAKFTGRVMGGK